MPSVPKIPSPDALPVLHFDTAKAWETWLTKNHASSKGIWLVMAKKDSGLSSPSRPEALDGALCWGWIDSQVAPGDEKVYLQRYSPRRPKGFWSKINRDKVAVLIADGRMKPPGQREIDNAKADGRWDAAYDSPKTATVHPDLEAAFEKNAKAREAFGKLNGTNRYAVLWRVQTAKKDETRKRRVESLIEMLERGELIHQPVEKKPKVSASKKKAVKKKTDGKLLRREGSADALDLDPRLECLRKKLGGDRSAIVTGGKGFGAHALKVNGKIFAMVINGSLVLKLPKEKATALYESGKAKPLSMGDGRMMRGWAMFPRAAPLSLPLARAALAFVGAAPE